MATAHPNTFGARQTLTVNGADYEIFSLKAPGLNTQAVERLPYSIKVLLENLLRHEDGKAVRASEIEAILNWANNPTEHGESAGDAAEEISFTPERVLMQDFTGVPAVVDLAGMRDAILSLGGDPGVINPLVPCELVIDHSVIVEHSGQANSLDENVAIEYYRNLERYQFLKWAQGSFDNFTVVPPGVGICHQVNLEHLARVVFATPGGQAYCDTVVGTDSHTTMVNGLGVLGWGVGGIEAEAAMLGQPVSMLLPQVVGLRLTGSLREGVTATDLVLRITELLRQTKVVGKFVEAFGPGVAALSLETRATIGNMTPEYGATATIFPIDQKTIDYLAFTGRERGHLDVVEAYAKAQGLWHDPFGPEPIFSQVVELDLATVEPSLAGPSRPQDRIALTETRTAFSSVLGHEPKQVMSADGGALADGAVVVAAITSCTNTSNPSVLIAAGLVAKAAHERGLTPKPWVKTSLAPGSRVVVDYLERAGLMPSLEALGFYLVGFGCTTCIGNTGPLLPGVSELAKEHDLSVVSVLSGNRNFEGRIHPDVKMNYLASPPLVVAYAIAGTMDLDLTTEPLGFDRDGQPVFLADLWPSDDAVADAIRGSLDAEMFATRYATAFEGDEHWKAVATSASETYGWADDSTYIKKPSYLNNLPVTPAPIADIDGARVLAVLGNSVTTDHISPAGNISLTSPAASYLSERGEERANFNSYGARRGNYEVMTRGTFANVRLRNRLAPGTEGGVSRHLPEGTEMSIYDASAKYQAEGVPLVVFAGQEYGSGSSRDWAAKGTALLGIKAVVAESYERIHRSNLIGMGVLPLQFQAGQTFESLGLTGEETFAISGLAQMNSEAAPAEVTVTATAADGTVTTFTPRLRIDTPMELEYYRHGGILQYVLRQLAAR